VLAADAAPNPWFDPSYVTDNWDTIVGYLGQHVRLTVGAVLLGTLIALRWRCSPGAPGCWPARCWA
jgi:osmoprotectant transport system permease protein